tara:strand:+ start:6194 stop:6379 length:186 start_codon:yes stop_codon:yes gene_type:complete
MKIGDLVRIREEWICCYPPLRGVVGVICEVIKLRNGVRIRWVHGYETEDTTDEVLEIVSCK